jgi:hypothetical protein
MGTMKKLFAVIAALTLAGPALARNDHGHTVVARVAWRQSSDH